MSTINISLPEKLKKEAEALVDSGLYISFSDLVRDSLRQIVAKNKYDLLTDEAKRDEKKGKARTLKTNKDVDDYIQSL